VRIASRTGARLVPKSAASWLSVIGLPGVACRYRTVLA
jgi:hypothetical protein